MATPLTLDQMKAFVRAHFEDFVNKRDASATRRNMTPDFHDHDGPGGKLTGAEGDEQMMLATYKSMPDLRVTSEDMIAEGDKVMCRNIGRWSDATSGKRMQFRGFVVWRPCIIGFGSSPSRCGPDRHMAGGQTRDLPGSNAILSCVMWPQTPANPAPRIAVLPVLPSTVANASAPATSISWLFPTPHMTAVYASPGRRRPRRNTRYRTDATPYPDRTCTGWITPAIPGAPLFAIR
jgi:predicted ester cyclase